VQFAHPASLNTWRESFSEVQDHLCESRFLSYLKNLQERTASTFFDALRRAKRKIFNVLVGLNKALTKNRPRPGLSRPPAQAQVHEAFGGELRAIIVGGAFH